MGENEEIKIAVRNRKAKHDYQIHWTIEAGIELHGCEVKSIRDGKINISDAYAVIENGQAWLKNLHISPYEMDSSNTPYDPIRPRRLLLHKREIRKLSIQTDQKGMTIVPLAIYFRNKLAKVELAVATGRKKYDKRQAVAKAEADRRMRKAIRKDM
ncbi:MAG TPA: SsrA-binding protein SmpB [candidate division Zixibacteria bacterium]|nr:SsrA-binding protein SmpB [candidate division Zixibacteria bacterium]